MDADTDLNRWLAASLAFAIEVLQPPEHLEGRLQGIVRLSGNSAITASPTYLSITPLCRVIAGSMALRYWLTNWNVSAGDHLLGEPGEIPDVGEQYGHHALDLVAERHVDDALLAELLEELPRHEPARSCR